MPHINLSLKTNLSTRTRVNGATPETTDPLRSYQVSRKFLSTFVHKQLLAYSLEAGIIPDEQFGFLPLRSTVWQLLFVLEEVQRALDEGGRIHACFLDIQKLLIEWIMDFCGEIISG